MPITIRCPKCSTKLRIDDAFSAGVCRCGKCGQTMKVPKRQSKDARIAESQKAQRPDAPPSVPAPEESFGASDPLADLARHGEMPTDKAPAPPPVTPARAPKRTGNKAMMFVVIGGSFVIIGGLIALAVFALGGDKTKVRKEVREELGFDPTVNPFTAEQGNILGVPLAERAVIAIDASGTSRQWFSLVTDAVMAGAKNLGSKSSLQVVFWMEDAPAVQPKSGPTTMTEQALGALQRFMDDAGPSGQADAVPAIVQAVKASPEQIVLITSQRLFPEALKELSEVLGGYPNVRVDAIAIDQELPDLKELIETRGGRFVTMPQSRIEDWYRKTTP